MNKRFLSVFCLCMLKGICEDRSNEPHEISLTQAAKLVELALQGSPTRRLPGFGLEAGSMPYFPEYYFFDGTWENPQPGSGVAGHWAVNKKTGDVWEPFACKLLSGKHLNSELSRLRKQMSISPSDVRRERANKPCL